MRLPKPAGNHFSVFMFCWVVRSRLSRHPAGRAISFTDAKLLSLLLLPLCFFHLVFPLFLFTQNTKNQKHNHVSIYSQLMKCRFELHEQPRNRVSQFQGKASSNPSKTLLAVGKRSFAAKAFFGLDAVAAPIARFVLENIWDEIAVPCVRVSAEWNEEKSQNEVMTRCPLLSQPD